MAKLFRVVKASSGHNVGTVVMRVPALLEGISGYKYLGVWYEQVMYLWNSGAKLAPVKCTKANLRAFDKTLRQARAYSKRLTPRGV